MRSKWRIVPMMIAGLMCTTAWAQDDLAAGRKLALNQCGVCHTFKAGEPNRQGPGLFAGTLLKPDELQYPVGAVDEFALR